MILLYYSGQRTAEIEQRQVDLQPETLSLFVSQERFHD